MWLANQIPYPCLPLDSRRCRFLRGAALSRRTLYVAKLGIDTHASQNFK